MSEMQLPKWGDLNINETQTFFNYYNETYNK